MRILFQEGPRPHSRVIARRPGGSLLEGALLG
jgi:hypothetical protein